MDLTQHSIESVQVIDATGWSQAKIESQLKKLSKQKKDNEVYFVTTAPIKVSLENFPEGQVLSVVIGNTNRCAESDIQDLLSGLGQLRDYYPDLTVKITDEADSISPEALPEDTIVKKNQEH